MFGGLGGAVGAGGADWAGDAVGKAQALMAQLEEEQTTIQVAAARGGAVVGRGLFLAVR